MSNFNVFKDFIKSLRFRLIILFILMGVIPGMVLWAGVLNSYEQRAVSIKTSEILGQAKILVNQIVSNDYLNNTDSVIISAELQQLSNIYDGKIMLIDSGFRVVKDTYDIDTGKIIISKEVIQSYKGTDITKYDPESRYIEIVTPLLKTNVATGEQAPIGVMMISVSTDSINLNMEYLGTNIFVIQMICGMLVIILAVWLSIHLTKPLKKMSLSIDEIETGYGTGKLIIHDYTETLEICEKFNSLLGRMKVLDESRQEFVSNVSHELKTPLTSMKVLADSINSMGDAPVELYKEFMADIGQEIDRETKIINDLLSLVKMDKSAADLNIVSLNINELLEQILKRLKPIAEKQQVELVFESFRPVIADVDEVKITLAFSNLIENAIKYNNPEGWVRVSLNADHQYMYLKVEDNGMGIPEADMDHIFERFYRVDKSHSREIGGTGLGLAITRSAILMHKGAVKVFSTEGEGTIFNVRIPLKYIV
ncbi:MAG: two-component sensor histidine kinase [Roseburia sp.]|nr:two-component sensor histidine kinase [Roseburia sp.]